MENFLYFLPSLVVLIVVAFTFYLNSVKVTKQLLSEKWQELIESMYERLDQIPLMMELCSVDPQRKEAILMMRARCLSEKNLTKEKIENELLMSGMTKEMITYCSTNANTQRKILLEAAFERFRALGKKIDLDAEKLNEQIRKYNGKLKWPVLSLVAKMRGFGPMVLVEFEP